MSRILLAPMEGLADPLMRDVLTALGGYDWGICEFLVGFATFAIFVVHRGWRS